MFGLSLYESVCLGLVVSGVLIFVSLFFTTAPYGRYDRKGWGPEIDERLVWMAMEIVSPLAFLALFWTSFGEGRAPGTANLILMAMFCGHYAYRALIYPFRIRGPGKKPVATGAMAILFNTFNGSVNGWAAANAAHLDAAWLSSPVLYAGLAVFLFGMWLNLNSDHILRTLRGPGETGYKIPTGGGFRFVTSPNYLGEIIEWTGYAIAACTLAGASFAVFTFANLAPRAATHHKWYHQKFPDYPKSRKAILPGVW
ncbi:MAG: DUF1295 domain-containing protein [Pseudomonadota bacterium]